MTVLLDILWKPEVSPLHIFAGAAVLVALSVVAYARTWSGRRKANTFLLVMRLAVIAAIATLLMGPSNIAPSSGENSRPQLTVLLDASGSMLTDDCTRDRKAQSRIDCALGQWLSPQQRQKLGDLYDVRFMSFSGEVSPLPESAFSRPGAELAIGRETNLAQCVSKAILDLPGQSRDWAVLVISDGHDSGDVPLQSAALLGRARNCPIHAVCLGGQGVQQDLALAAMCKEEYLLAKEPGQIIAKVYQVGYDGKKATVHLHAEVGLGQSQPGAAVPHQDPPPGQVKTVEFKAQPSATVSFPIAQAKAGLYEYKVSVDPLPGETELGNNAQSVFCQVTDQKIRVLLLEGEPFWETKFLAQSLRKDPGVELTQITRVSNRKQESVITNVTGGPSAGGAAAAEKVELPKTADEFAKYDVIILGKGIEQLYDPSVARRGESAVSQLLPDFVSRRGGSIVFTRGQAYDPETPAGRQMGRDLAVIEPVVWGRGYLHNMSLSLTADGRVSPCFRFAGLTQDVAEAVGAMPGFAIMPVVEREKVSAVVLASDVPPGAARGAGAAGGQPGIVQMKYGRGQVIAILGEGLWRWSLLAPDMKAYDSVYDEFWSNTVRALAMGSDFLPGQTVCLKIGRSSVRLGDPVTMEAVFKTASSGPAAGQVKVTLTGPDGKNQEVPLAAAISAGGRMQGSYTPRQTGVYRVLLETPGMNPPRQEKRFSVFDVNIERLQTAANPEALRLLAEQSGGLFFQAGASAGGLPEALARHQESRGVLPQVNFLWDKAPILVVLLVWMGAEWLGRRRAGLL